MRDLLSSNVFESEEKTILCASCLEYFDKEAWKKVLELNGKIFKICLETHHMNMAAHKIASMIETGNIKELIFISIDKSPHCIQLQYIRKELEKQMKGFDLQYKSFVVSKGELIEIGLDTISLSKNLAELSNIKNKLKNTG